MEKPTDRFREALGTWLHTMKPGTCLEPVRVLAPRFGVAEITIRRILREYADSGRVVLIPGKGTVIAGDRETTSPVAGISRTSAEEVAAHIENMIRRGAIKRGERLWPLKHLSLQFGVSMQTVTGAYRLLESKSYITKVGRSYCVGDFESALSVSFGKRMVIVPFVFTSMGELYFPARGMALARRRMEWELIQREISLVYHPASRLLTLCNEWMHTGMYPAGLVLVHPGREDMEQRMPLFSTMQKRAASDFPSMVIEAQAFTPHPKTSTLVCTGHADTTLARTIARYVQRGRFTSVFFFYDPSLPAQRSFVAYLKIRGELSGYAPGVSFTPVIMSKKTGNKDNAIDPLFAGYPVSRLESIFSKYHPVSFQHVRESIVVASSFHPFKEHMGASTLWICAQDRHAVAAREWAANRGISVPKSMALLSLENAPEYLHHGISAAVVDWETTGYLMAHALLKSFPVATTTKGLMENKALLLHRETTVAW